MSDDDAALIIAVRGGSELAFNRLVDRHQEAVRVFLWRLRGHEADADDMAQETFLTAWTHARSFRGEASVRGWLCGIAWRKAKGAQRSWAQRRSRETTYQEGRSSDDARGPAMEDRLAVKRALQSLSLE